MGSWGYGSVIIWLRTMWVPLVRYDFVYDHREFGVVIWVDPDALLGHVWKREPLHQLARVAIVMAKFFPAEGPSSPTMNPKYARL